MTLHVKIMLHFTKQAIDSSINGDLYHIGK